MFMRTGIASLLGGMVLLTIACNPNAHSAKSSTAYSSGTSRTPSSAKILLGSETLARRNFDLLAGKRVGLLTNPSGVTSRGESAIDLLRRAPNVNLVALFAPEHGVYGEILAGGEFKDHKDRRTGLPVYSLYGPGPVREPTVAMLSNIDVLVYDLQDTGCRSYTFISTMGKAMNACGRAGKQFVVLDRPNPLGGLRVEGNLLSPEIDKLDTLVAYWNVPYVYGMTSGELALMINDQNWNEHKCKVTVMPMAGWKRGMVWDDTGLNWVPTSPNIRTGEAPLYYVSTGILGEIGGVDIGIRRGKPFQIVAAPWLSGPRFAARMNAYQLPGVQFVPYRGTSDQYVLQGVEIKFTDPARAPLTPINFYALDAIKKETGRDLFADAVKRKSNFKMFDKVNGTTATRKELQAGVSPTQIVKSWVPDEAKFRRERAKYLIYP
jgi:uncharacterized protein YbbC (DUF1343 family)